MPEGTRKEKKTSDDESDSHRRRPAQSLYTPAESLYTPANSLYSPDANLYGNNGAYQFSPVAGEVLQCLPTSPYSSEFSITDALGLAPSERQEAIGEIELRLEDRRIRDRERLRKNVRLLRLAEFFGAVGDRPEALMRLRRIYGDHMPDEEEVAALLSHIPTSLVVEFLQEQFDRVQERDEQFQRARAEQDRTIELMSPRRNPYTGGYGPGLMIGPMAQTVGHLGQDFIEAIRNASSNSGHFLAGFFDEIAEQGNRSDAERLARQMMTAAVLNTLFPPVFLSGAVVGFVRNIIGLPEAIRALIENFDDLVELVTEFVRLLFSPEGAELADALGREVGGQVLGDLRELVALNPFEFTYRLGELVGPLLIELILSFVLPGAVITLAARTLRAFRAVARELPRLARLLRLASSQRFAIRGRARTPLSAADRRAIQAKASPTGDELAALQGWPHAPDGYVWYRRNGEAHLRRQRSHTDSHPPREYNPEINRFQLRETTDPSPSPSHSGRSTAWKGRFGEQRAHEHMIERGYVLRGSSQQPGPGGGTPRPQGIDGVYENLSPPPRWVVVEAKYGTSTYGTTADGPQMSQRWVNNRLEQAVGLDMAITIRSEGYVRRELRVAPSGSVTESSIQW